MYLMRIENEKKKFEVKLKAATITEPLSLFKQMRKTPRDTIIIASAEEQYLVERVYQNVGGTWRQTAKRRVAVKEMSESEKMTYDLLSESV